MGYVYNKDSLKEKERLVEAVYLWEKDKADHEDTLARYKEVLKDPTFTGRTLTDSQGNEVTFRQKLESELVVLEQAIKECDKLIEVSVADLPEQKIIDEVVARLEAPQQATLV